MHFSVQTDACQRHRRDDNHAKDFLQQETQPVAASFGGKLRDTVLRIPFHETVVLVAGVGGQVVQFFVEKVRNFFAVPTDQIVPVLQIDHIRLLILRQGTVLHRTGIADQLRLCLYAFHRTVVHTVDHFSVGQIVRNTTRTHGAIDIRLVITVDNGQIAAAVAMAGDGPHAAAFNTTAFDPQVHHGAAKHSKEAGVVGTGNGKVFNHIPGTVIDTAKIPAGIKNPDGFPAFNRIQIDVRRLPYPFLVETVAAVDQIPENTQGFQIVDFIGVCRTAIAGQDKRDDLRPQILGGDLGADFGKLLLLCGKFIGRHVAAVLDVMFQRFPGGTPEQLPVAHRHNLIGHVALQGARVKAADDHAVFILARHTANHRAPDGCLVEAVEDKGAVIGQFAHQAAGRALDRYHTLYRKVADRAAQIAEQTTGVLHLDIHIEDGVSATVIVAVEGSCFTVADIFFP